MCVVVRTSEVVSEGVRRSARATRATRVRGGQRFECSVVRRASDVWCVRSDVCEGSDAGVRLPASFSGIKPNMYNIILY